MTLCGRVQQTEWIIKKNHHDVYVPAMFTVQTDYGQMSYHLRASVLHIGEHTTYGHYEAAVFKNSKIGYLCNDKAVTGNTTEAILKSAKHKCEVLTRCEQFLLLSY